MNGTWNVPTTLTSVLTSVGHVLDTIQAASRIHAELSVLPRMSVGELSIPCKRQCRFGTVATERCRSLVDSDGFSLFDRSR